MSPGYRVGLLLLAIASIAAGCAKSTAPEPQKAVNEAAEQEPPARKEGEETVTMSGINLYLHQTDPTQGLARKPTFWVHANKFAMLGDKTWSFEDARAVAYGKEAQKEEIVMEAKSGQFVEDKGASLRDGVKAYVGEMTMQLKDIEWENPQDKSAGIAHSDSGVKINDPTMQLEAAALRLYPDTKTFELTDVSGLVHFGKTGT